MEKSNENPWTFVDSDGEEDEDVVNSWQHLSESDVILLLKQVPFEHIFSKMLLMNLDEKGQYEYDVRRTSESLMMKIIALARALVDTLGMGLQTFQLGRYRQFNKRLAKLISEVAQHVCLHHGNFVSVYPAMSPLLRERLQLELDQLCLLTFTLLLNHHKQGTWQYISQLPFGHVSETAIWRMLALMLQCPDSGMQSIVSDTSDTAVAGGCSKRPSLDDVLSSLSPTELTYMLMTMANMACARPSHESNLLEVLVHDMYEISYVSHQTRELCSKQGRPLLASLVSVHPLTVSLLIKEVNASLSKVGPMALHLFSSLTLTPWTPADVPDWATLRRWLIDCPVGSVENQLARLVLERLNWGTNGHGRLVLNTDFHLKMALLVAEACTQHLKGKAIAGLFTDGSKQISEATQPGQSDDYALATWCWQMVLRLRVHESQLVMERTTEGAPDLSDYRLQPLRTALMDNHAQAAYLAVLISSLGNRVQSFMGEGLALTAGLAEKQHFVPVLRILACVVPLFYTTPDMLLEHDRFKSMLATLTHAGCRKGIFFGEFPGVILSHFSSLIQHQISGACQMSIQDGQCVVRFWLRVLTSLPGWMSDRCCLYLVDNVFKCAFLNADTWKHACDSFIDITKKTNSKQEGGSWSLFSWLSSGSTKASLIDSASCAEFSYYAFATLAAETAWEEETGMWLELHKHLTAGTMTLDAAFKKACLTLKLENYPVLSRLSIYRWAQQAVDMDFTHPLLPLVWQQHFLRFLARRCLPAGIPQAGGLGLKFFDGGNAPFTRKMKRRLMDTSDHYRKLTAELREKRLAAAADGESEDRQQESLDMQQIETFERLFRFYQTLSFWVDEQLLHDANLYLPSLPKEYEAERLLTLLQHQQVLWMDVVDVNQVVSQVNEAVSKWVKLISFDDNNVLGRPSPATQQQLTSAEKIVRQVQRLQADYTPQSPPMLTKFTSVTAELSPGLVMDQIGLMQALSADLTLIVDYAKLYGLRYSKLCSLDLDYVEILPQLYHNISTEAVLQVPCKSSLNLLHKCTGPAVLRCRHEAKARRDNIHRRLGENRAEYKQLTIESSLPPAQIVCTAAMRVNGAIRTLSQLLFGCSSEKTHSQVTDIGTSLFYHVAQYVTDETQFNIPTRQFLSAAIENLGQTFIRGNPSQPMAVLHSVLQSPRLVGLVAPCFQPNLSPQTFVHMYCELQPVALNQGPDIAVMMLSKFDIGQWLHSSNASLSERVALIDNIGTALCQCGQKPADKISSVFELYLSHLQSVLMFQWPEHIGSVLKMIIRGSSQNELSVRVWDVFLSSLGCRSDTTVNSNTGAKSPPTLTSYQVKELMMWLTTYFANVRQQTSASRSFGLYPTWKVYVPHICTLLQYLSVCCCDQLNESATRTAVDIEQGTEVTWKQITELFDPWIQPLDQSLPWIQADNTQASQMVSVWVGTMDKLQAVCQDRMPVFARNALSHVWTYYVAHVASESVGDNVQHVYHANLTSLPWHRLMPDLLTVETMVKIVKGEGYSKASVEFFASVFPSIPWTFIVDCYSRSEIGDVVSHLHALIFTLVVLLSFSKTVRKDPTRFNEFLSQSEFFHWSAMTSEAFEQGINLFLQHAESDWLVTASSTATPFPRILRFLRVTSTSDTTVSRTTLSAEAVHKQLHYVRCLGQVISRCTFVKQVDVTLLQRSLRELITEVDGLVGNVTSPIEQQNVAVMLTSQLVTVLNQSNAQTDIQQALLTIFTQWLAGNVSSNLVVPFVVSACRNMAAMPNLVVLLESCIEAYFASGHNDVNGWQVLVTAVQAPELSRATFVDEALRLGSYLVLQVTLLKHLSHATSLDDELSNLTQLVHWIETTKTTVHAGGEAKLFLWWVKCVELLLRQLDFGGDCAVVRQLVTKMLDTVTVLAEDKSSAGLLGVIGLGKKSVFSPRFRVVAKIWGAFVSAQMIGSGALRLQSGDTGCPGDPRRRTPPTSPQHARPSVTTSQLLTQLANQLTAAQKQPSSVSDKLAPNTSSADFVQRLADAIGFICSPQNTLRDSPRFLVDLVSYFYPDKSFLAVLRQA